MRRVAALLALLLGFTLVGFTFAEHLFSRAQDAQTISDRYASLMSASGLHGLRTGFDAVQAAGAELARQGGAAPPRRTGDDRPGVRGVRPVRCRGSRRSTSRLRAS